MKKIFRIVITLILAAFMTIAGALALNKVEFKPVSIVRFTPPDVFVDIKAWISYTGNEANALSSYNGATYTGGTAKDKADDWKIGGVVYLSEANPAIILTMEFTNADSKSISITVTPPENSEGKFIKTGGLTGVADGTNYVSAVKPTETAVFKFIFTLTQIHSSFTDDGNFNFTVVMTKSNT